MAKDDIKVSWMITAFIAVFLLLWMIYYNSGLIAPLLEKNPVVWRAYSFVNLQIEQKSLFGLAALCFFGSLFFVFIPVELTFVYYLSLEHSKLLVFFISVSGYMAGLVLNYLIGLLFGRRFLFKGGESEKLQKRVDRFGGLIIIFGYIFFFPMQFITAALGAFRYPFKKFFIITFIMLALKFVIILIAGDYFIAEILPRLQLFF